MLMPYLHCRQNIVIHSMTRAKLLQVIATSRAGLLQYYSTKQLMHLRMSCSASYASMSNCPHLLGVVHQLRIQQVLQLHDVFRRVELRARHAHDLAPVPGPHALVRQALQQRQAR